MADAVSTNQSNDEAKSITPRPVGDFFAPVFKVQFTNTLGVTGEVSQVPGSTLASIAFNAVTRAVNTALRDVAEAKLAYQNEVDKPMFELVARCAASIVIESVCGGPFKMTLTLTPTYEDAVRILESQVITFLTVVTATWGYVTSDGSELMSDPHQFAVQQPSASFGENMTITIVGHDMTSELAKRKTQLRKWRRVDYPTDWHIISTICGEVNYSASAHNIPARNTVFQPRTPKEPEDDSNDLTQVVTNWQLIKQICRLHSLTFRIEGTRVVFFDLFRPKDATFTYVFKWRTAPTGAYDIPLYSISGTILGSMFIPPAGRSVVGISYNENTGETEFKKRVTSETAEVHQPNQELTEGEKHLGEALAKQFGTEVETPNGKKVKPAGGASNDKESDSVAGTWVSVEQELDNRSDTDNISKEGSMWTAPTVRVTCPGVVDLFPGQLVRVEGTGKFYDFVYTVKSVKHSLGSGGYDTEAELIHLGSYAPGAPNSLVKDTRSIKEIAEEAAIPRGLDGSPTSRRRPRRIG